MMTQQAPAIIRDKWAPRDFLKDAEKKGRRPRKKIASVWVDELAALGKAIMLCDRCEKRWDAKSVGYHGVTIAPGYRLVRGKCDGCETDKFCQLYIRSKT